MQSHWSYQDVLRVATSATSLMLTSATLPDNGQGTPPPPQNTPYFSILVMMCSAQPRSSTLTNFSPHATNLRALGCAEPMIPWDANLHGARSL